MIGSGRAVGRSQKTVDSEVKLGEALGINSPHAAHLAVIRTATFRSKEMPRQCAWIPKIISCRFFIVLWQPKMKVVFNIVSRYRGIERLPHGSVITKVYFKY